MGTSNSNPAPAKVSRPEDIAIAQRCYLYKEIGDRLNIGVETVRTYVKSICQKMHVRSRIEAVAKHQKVSI